MLKIRCFKKDYGDTTSFEFYHGKNEKDLVMRFVDAMYETSDGQGADSVLSALKDMGLIEYIYTDLDDEPEI